MSGNEDENEETSLLHSASAPPRPSLLNPYNPRNPPPQQQNQDQFYNKPRHTLTSANLAAMEASAARLAGDDNLDSDSVNGLLAGMEASDDEASAFGERAALDDRPVTMQELEFLALAKSRRASDLGMEGADDRELERRDSDELREESFRQQIAHDDKGMFLSARMHESTRALRVATGDGIRRNTSVGGGIVPPLKRPSSHAEIEPGDKEPLEMEEGKRPRLSIQVITMVTLTVLVVLLILLALALGTLAVGPPRQPLGEYQILEAQVGGDFWQYYDFYAGKDSAGSNGYITYVSREVAEKDDIIGVVTKEVAEEDMIEIYEDGDARAVEDWLAEDLEFLDWLERKKDALEDSKAFGGDEVKSNETGSESDDSSSTKGKQKAATKKGDNKHHRLLGDDASGPSPEFEPFAPLRFQNTTTDDAPPPRLEPFNPDPPKNGTDPSKPTETFVMISSSPTLEGPRNSVRLEGRRRFNRGLFIIDLRHMPAGCGTWPAFWLTDEANWPVNGEIDIVEGVNYQDTAKTALHSTKECVMNDVPEGSKTGSWDTAVGVPDGKTGKPDMTFRWAQNCFVYDPHQWINQGCVATDLKLEGRSLGMPLNANGGGVYALEWDPVNRHIRTYVFSPHNRVPRNLREALRTAQDPENAVAPDPNQWGLPYGHFPIGEGTNCPAGHFRNMRLVINLAFCGSVAGNRYFMDCPKKFKKYKTCNEWVKSDPEELKEAYWKIRGVYVYEREWERQWT